MLRKGKGITYHTAVRVFHRNNGFLAYYEVKQIPNFFLALPIISLTVGGLWIYAQYDWLWFWSLGFLSSKGLCCK